MATYFSHIASVFVVLLVGFLTGATMAKMFGDWNIIPKALNFVANAIPSVRDKTIDKAMADFPRFIEERIEKQYIYGPELAKSTVRQKKKKRADFRLLIEWGHYKKSFTSKQISKTEIEVSPETEEMEIRALVHEYGNEHTPARPHIGPAVEEYMKSDMVKWLKRLGFEIVPIKPSE